jgi:ppGpp synthetase/RelA/SpoT-type nucleotidyltranferase
VNDWVQVNVDRYAKVHGDYKLFADVLAKVLGIAARKLAPLAIVQARPKSIPSFAEKIIRKRHLYKDPLADMTDLCGGRVIAHTAEQVHAVCKFIEQHFTIDWDNSDDVSQRLRPTEFGYRSVHYIVSFKPGEFPGKDIPVEIPEVLFQGTDPADRALKAEIQVRTILEHAWADISHDMAYKTGFKVPARILRDFAAVAAVLEGTDREFARIHDGLRAYASEYGRYLKPDEIRAEIEQLDLVLGYDRENADLATRIATLAMAVGDWQRAVDVLTPYRSSDHQPALRTLGVALCKLSGGRGDMDGFVSGRKPTGNCSWKPSRTSPAPFSPGARPRALPAWWAIFASTMAPICTQLATSRASCLPTARRRWTRTATDMTKFVAPTARVLARWNRYRIGLTCWQRGLNRRT